MAGCPVQSFSFCLLSLILSFCHFFLDEMFVCVLPLSLDDSGGSMYRINSYNWKELHTCLCLSQ